MQPVGTLTCTAELPCAGISLSQRLTMGGAALAVALGCLLWQHLDPLLSLSVVPAGLAVNFAYDAQIAQQVAASGPFASNPLANALVEPHGDGSSARTMLSGLSC